MEMRITSQMTTKSLIDYMQTNMRSYDQLMEEVSSGHRVLTPSDDPIAAIEILNDDASIDKIKGYNTNITTAQNEINVTDGALTSVISNLEKAHDLAVQASNQTAGPEYNAAIKTQVDQIIQSLKDLGNTKYNDNYIFAGTKTATPPYTDNPTGGTQYVGTPSTGEYKRYTQISDDSNVSSNITGDTFLGSYDTTTHTGSGALASLYKLSAALGANDNTTIRASIDEIMGDINTTSTKRTNIAALTNRFTATTTSNTNKITLLTQSRSDAQDTDMATALTQMYSAKNSYTASMSVVSDMLNLKSLWDYMG
jgi:flagellar hook-associated protein 3 FlgL